MHGAAPSAGGKGGEREESAWETCSRARSRVAVRILEKALASGMWLAKRAGSFEFPDACRLDTSRDVFGEQVRALDMLMQRKP